MFELTRATTGAWSLTTLYSFSEQFNSPETAYSGVVINATGDLFGTVYGGAANGLLGNVYELTPPSGSGTWTESILHNFTGGSDGEGPVGGLLLYRGALVGTTSDCSQTLVIGCGSTDTSLR